jgi:hypothetical protein
VAGLDISHRRAMHGYDHPATSGPDHRVPVVTLLPQAGAVLAVADDPHTATLAFLLAAALNGPLLVAGRIDVQRAGVGWARPMVAVGWAACCLLLGAWTGGQMAAAARVAAVASVLTAALVHVVPGAWTVDGWRLAVRRGLGLPVARPYALVVLRRLIPVLLIAAIALFAFAPMAAVLIASAVLVALGAEYVLDNSEASTTDSRRERIPVP